jgi:hypothetical protein
MHPWLLSGVWRVAKRNPQQCADCNVSIPMHATYWDTNEPIEGRTRATYKLCIPCADTLAAG